MKENHSQYMKRIKKEDPILYSELTSNPTGTDTSTDNLFPILIFIVACLLCIIIVVTILK